MEPKSYLSQKLYDVLDGIYIDAGDRTRAAFPQQGKNGLLWQAVFFTIQYNTMQPTILLFLLYPIPRADSVPEALWKIVDRPIFYIEELTLEVVKARSYRISEAGGSDGWRMSFGVLYDDVLVELTTKGITPEVVFGLITEITHK